MNATIQTTPQKQTGRLLDGYDEITKNEFENMQQTFTHFLRSTFVGGSILKRAYVLATTRSILLLETKTNQFFVAHCA